MAVCTLDLSRPCFTAALASLPGTPEEKQKMLDTFREKVEKDHKCCHRVVQKFYGNKKYSHLHEKMWKYDWGESSAKSRKAWRMVVVVPEPHIEPYNLIAAAIYTKNVADQLPFAELAAIFDAAIQALPVSPDAKARKRRFPSRLERFGRKDEVYMRRVLHACGRYGA